MEAQFQLEAGWGRPATGGGSGFIRGLGPTLGFPNRARQTQSEAGESNERGVKVIPAGKPEATGAREGLGQAPEAGRTLTPPGRRRQRRLDV